MVLSIRSGGPVELWLELKNKENEWLAGKERHGFSKVRLTLPNTLNRWQTVRIDLRDAPILPDVDPTAVLMSLSDPSGAADIRSLAFSPQQTTRFPAVPLHIYQLRGYPYVTYM